jgi:hypothetical protein
MYLEVDGRIASGLSLAYIGSASAMMRVERRGVDPRRFRLGGEKEAAGACRGCDEFMEIESKHACNQLFS